MNSTTPPLAPIAVPRRVTVPLKFLACSAVTTTVWVLLIMGLLSSPTAVEVRRFLPYFAGVVATVLPAALVHFHFPRSMNGTAHRIGKGAALYISVNVTLSTFTIIHELNRVGVSEGSTPAILAVHVVGYGALASLYAPGPFLGALIAARWSRRPNTADENGEINPRGSN